MSSPTSKSLRAFRTMTLSSKPDAKDIQKVAAEVSGYVDAVAKERERERERIRREREGKDKPQETQNAKQRSERVTAAPQPSSIPSEPTDVVTANQMQPGPVKIEQVPDTAPDQVVVVVSPREESPAMEDIRPHDNSMTGLFSPPEMTLDELPPDEDVATQFKTETEAVLMDVKEEAKEDIVKPSGDSFFDPFDNFGSAWQSTSGQYKDEFMDINMDHNVGYQMDLASLGGGREATSDTGGFDVDNGFGVFTEDDFDFFDGPPAPTRATAIPPPPSLPPIDSGSGLTPAAGPAPLGLSPQILGDSIAFAGPGPPSVTHNQSSPWAPQPLGEAFVPRISDMSHLGSNMLVTPELLPPTPGKSPLSSEAPSTPAVHLSELHTSAKFGQYTSGSQIFDPIPFAPSHKAADGKYAIGKFALPSPPDEEDRTEPMNFPSSPFSRRNDGWKQRYSAATDPRIGMIRKLIGVKRKSFDQGARDRRSPLWVRQFEEWESAPSPPPEDTKSDIDSDDEPWIDGEDARTISRPSTPPPSYLPLGPTLLHTHFHHAHILPLSTPLRPSGLTVSYSGNATAPVSVPTPVSPAAVLGTTSEKSKSLEAAAQILVKEVVENYVWADAWHVNTNTSIDGASPPTDVWQSDVKRVAELFATIENAQAPVELEMLASIDPASMLPSVKLQVQDPPMLAIGKSDTVVHILPAGLRFWEKLGLGPRSGQKNVTAFVFFEGGGDEREAQLDQWLNQVSITYATKNYGVHSPGNSDSCVRPGLVPVHFDAFRKTLVNFISTLPLPHTNLVFYIITPQSILSLSSPILRQLFSAVKRALRTHSDAHLLIQFVPEDLTTGIITDPRAAYSGLEPFVDSVYDRVLQPVERAMSRELFANSARTTESFHAPAFILTRTLPGQHGNGQSQLPLVSFVLDPHPRSLDVLERYALLHVGYQFSSCGRWLLACCVDSRGEAHDLGTWLVKSDVSESIFTSAVNRIWSFVSSFARQAHVEWRIVIAKLGGMGPEELEAWMALLDCLECPPEFPPLHVTVLTVDRENPLIFLPTLDKRPQTTPTPSSTSSAHSRSSGRTPQGAVFTDASSTTYALYSHCSTTLVPTSAPLALSPPCICNASTIHGIPGASDIAFIPDCEDENIPPGTSDSSPGSSASVEEKISHLEALGRARGASALISVPASNDHLSISMLKLVRLYIARIPAKNGTSAEPTVRVGDDKEQEAKELEDFEERTMKDITRNFYELAVLARLRWKLNGQSNSVLPFHLAALDTMRTVLAREID